MKRTEEFALAVAKVGEVLEVLGFETAATGTGAELVQTGVVTMLGVLGVIGIIGVIGVTGVIGAITIYHIYHLSYIQNSILLFIFTFGFA